ncbi:MAG: zf-HC2 domain-containing protein [Acidobacteriia bacterium]|nr:zf-HC2 domain-containing protein [Terriglobia bacterium]
MMRHTKKTRLQQSTRCKDLLRTVADYLDGELPQPLCVELETHIKKCQTCDCVIDALKKTLALYKRMPEIEIPPKTRRDLDHLLKKRCLGQSKN